MNDIAYRAMAPVYVSLVRRKAYTIDMVPVQVRSYVIELLNNA